MAEGSVGSVYLDLVVRDTVEKQVQGIAVKAQAQTKKSFAGMEETIGAAVEKAVARATKAATAAASSASRAATQAADAAQKAVQAAAASATTCGQQVENTVGKSFSKSVALAQAKVSQLERAFDAVGNKLDVLWNSGKFNPNDKATQSLLVQQERIYAQIEAARERLAIEVQAAAQKQAAAEEAAALKAAQAAQKATAAQQAAAQQTTSVQQSASNQQQAAVRQSESVQVSAYSRIKGAASTAFSAIRNISRSALSAMNRAISSLVKSVGALKNRLTTAGKSAGGFGSRLKGILSGALVFNVLSRGLNNVVQYMGEALGESQQLQAALANLKGAAVTAAAPLLESITPALVGIANAAATAFSYLSRLVSYFTGKSLSSMTAAAKKLQSTANAAKKSVAGFDEITKLGDSSSGSEGAKVKAPEFDFQGKSPFLDSILNAVKSGDWGQVGAAISKKLNGAVATITWPDIRSKIQSWIHGVAATINGFVGMLDFEAVGNTIGNAIDTVVTSIADFFAGVDWLDIGSGFGRGITEIFVSVDWPGHGAAIGTEISNLIEGIGKFFVNIDWTRIGSGFGRGVTSIFTSLDWAGYSYTVSGGINGVIKAINAFFVNTDWTRIGSGLGIGLSGIFARIDWVGFGKSLTNGINTALQMLHGFIKDFDFSEFGNYLAEATMGAINNIDWVQGAKDLGNAAIGLIDMLTAWIAGIEWQQIGRDIADCVRAVDWAGLVSSVSEGIGAALGGLGALLWGLIEEEWNSMMDTWLENTERCGGDVMAGLLLGILEGLANIGVWIWDNVFVPIWEGITEAFDIHSPSKKMEGLGGYIIEGLLNGVSSAWTTITEFFSESFESVKKTVTEIWEDGILPAIKGPINSIIECINGMISGICEGINTVIRALNKLSFKIPSWVPVLGGESFGFNLSTIAAPKIPMLADGGIITQPTLAMMGEYAGARNNPEIAAPQSLIAETVAGVMEDVIQSNIAGHEATVAVLQQILEAVYGIDTSDGKYARAVERYQQKMAIVRGG